MRRAGGTPRCPHNAPLKAHNSRPRPPGVPVKNYKLPTEWVKPGAIVVNVASYKNVDEEALMKVPGVKYVPLVGKVTIAMLERNLVRAVEWGGVIVVVGGGGSAMRLVLCVGAHRLSPP